jgi:hydrogenase maturation factor
VKVLLKNHLSTPTYFLIEKGHTMTKITDKRAKELIDDNVDFEIEERE